MQELVYYRMLVDWERVFALSANFVFYTTQHEKFLQFDWLRAVVFEIPTSENYKPFVGSSINK